jgi:hypothetical protein
LVSIWCPSMAKTCRIQHTQHNQWTNNMPLKNEEISTSPYKIAMSEHSLYRPLTAETRVRISVGPSEKSITVEAGVYIVPLATHPAAHLSSIVATVVPPSRVCYLGSAWPIGDVADKREQREVRLRSRWPSNWRMVHELGAPALCKP